MKDKMTLDAAGYPTEMALQAIVDAPWETFNDALALVEAIKSIWWMPDWGFKIAENDTAVLLELHTGGWSGNEDIIRALRQNMFWPRYWDAHRRGGHYYFEISKPKQTIGNG